MLAGLVNVVSASILNSRVLLLLVRFSVSRLVILAMGFVGVENNRIIDELGIQLDDRGNVMTDECHMTNVKGIFAAGDMATGQSLIVRAMDHGRKTAQGIMPYLTNG